MTGCRFDCGDTYVPCHGLSMPSFFLLSTIRSFSHPFLPHSVPSSFLRVSFCFGIGSREAEPSATEGAQGLDLFEWRNEGPNRHPGMICGSSCLVSKTASSATSFGTRPSALVLIVADGFVHMAVGTLRLAILAIIVVGDVSGAF